MFHGPEMISLTQTLGGTFAGLVCLLVLIAGCTSLRRFHEAKD